MCKLDSLAPYAFAALAAAFSIPAHADFSQGDGYCHLSRWSPDTLVEQSNFAAEVALDGSLAVVAAWGDSEVYVYERQGANWVEIDRLVDPHPGDNEFGQELALHGERIAVGAHLDGTAAPEAGAVHVFERQGDSFVLTETLFDPTPVNGAHFGIEVAMTATWLAVGATHDTGGGSVNMFVDSVPGWTHTDEIKSPIGQQFGFGVAMHEMGPLAVELFVGNPYDDVIDTNSGAVERYRVSPVLVTPKGTLRPLDLTYQALFGRQLAYDGEHLIVSAPTGHEAGGSWYGRAYLFEAPFDGAGMTHLETFLPPEEPGLEFFGLAVDVDDGRVAVGSSTEGPLNGGGAAYVYSENVFGTAWELEDRIEPADLVPYGFFGHALSLQGDGLLVGSPTYDMPETGSGAAHFVSLTPSGGLAGQCACDALTSAESYGEGKPGTLGVPLLESSLAVPGANHVLGLSNVLVGTAPLLMWGLEQTALPLDGGTLLVWDPLFIVMPVVGPLGQVGVGWNVPLNPVICGVELFAQALLLDPGAGGEYHTAQSNGVHMTIGY